MRRVLSSVAYVLACVTAFEVWQGFLTAYSKTSEFFSILDGPDSLCHTYIRFVTTESR